MTEPVLIFETDPQSGTPRLQAVHGAASPWGPKDLGQLEEQLRARYEGLVRAGAGTIDLRGRTLYVRKKDGDTSRQPTLEVRTAEEPAPEPVSAASGGPSPPTAAADWTAGLLGEIDRLLASPAFQGLLPVERAMLQLVRDEFQGLLEKAARSETALLLLVSVLSLAEHLCRTQRPGEPHPYAYALGGIERL
jgi:hypothetical protein